MLEDLTKFYAQSLCGQPRRIRQQLIERSALQCADAELRQDFLLTNTLTQCAYSDFFLPPVRVCFDDRGAGIFRIGHLEGRRSRQKM